MKKVLAILLSIFLLATMIPLGAVNVSAATEEERIIAQINSTYTVVKK